MKIKEGNKENKRLVKESLNRYKWILYKLSYPDDRKIWHELHKKNNKLRHVDTKLCDRKKSTLTSSFKAKGHNFNLSNGEYMKSSQSLTNINKYDINNNKKLKKGISFSQLPRFKCSLSRDLTYAETLGLNENPLENKFISNHTNRRKCINNTLSKSLTLSSINISKINQPSSAFLSTQRTELFDLDKIAKEHEFEKIDTESVIFESNARYWLRNNVGFKMSQIPKRNRKNKNLNDENDKENKDITIKSNQQKKTKLPKIASKKRKNLRKLFLNNKNSKNEDDSTLKVDHRRLIGSASLSNIVSSNMVSSTSRSVERNVIDSPVLKVKLRERTPINHTAPKKYIYKNIFDKDKNIDKIYVLGTSSIH